MRALFFLDGDDGGDFGLLGSGGFLSRNGTLRSIAACLRRGCVFQRHLRRRRSNDLDRLILDMMGRKVGKITGGKARSSSGRLKLRHGRSLYGRFPQWLGFAAGGGFVNPLLENGGDALLIHVDHLLQT